MFMAHPQTTSHHSEKEGKKRKKRKWSYYCAHYSVPHVGGSILLQKPLKKGVSEMSKQNNFL